MSTALVRAVSTAGAFLVLLAFAAGELEAQTGVVTGSVVAEHGEALGGAQVSIAELELGTLTRDNGRYLLTNVPAGTHTISVTYVGYANASQEVTVTAGQDVVADFTLSQTAINLEEIVVTGTGAPTQRRQLGQTINTVSSEELETAPVTSVTDALQGRVPGMTGGAFGYTGSGTRIRLRGTVSLSQRNEPLIYVDGVRMDNSSNDVASVATTRLNDIDPSNIDHIEVIKGAAAATLFGTEASSGVIQIFTKRGTVSDPVYSFRMDQQIVADEESRVPNNYGYDEATGRIMENNPFRDYHSPGHYQNYSLSIRGGTPGVKYFASGRLMSENAPIPNNELRNYALRTALDFRHTDKFSSSVDVSVTRNNLLAPYPTWGLFAEFILADPSNTSPTRPYGEQDYTVEGALDYQTREITDNRMISLSLNYAWLDNLRSSLTAGVNDIGIEETNFIPVGGGNPNAPSSGSKSIGNRDITSWTLDFKNNLDVDLSESINSSTAFGAQSFWEKRIIRNVGVSDFPSPALETLRGGSVVTNVDESQEEVINAGLFVQQQFGFNNRLFLTGGLRVDGNSAFGDDFGFEFYPKVGASWVVSDESFWNIDGIDQFRLRAAYGTSGLQPGAFDAQRTWSPGAMVQNNQVVLPLNLGNPDLKPERSSETEVAAEITALDNRLGFEVVYYKQKTTDALLPKQGSPSLGFTRPQLTNIGALESTGWELSTDFTPIHTPGFEWSLRGSYSHINQEVTDMGGVAPFRIEGRRRWSQIRQGYAPGAVLAPVHDPNNPYTISVPIDQLSSRNQIQPNWLQAADGSDSLVYIGDSSPTWNATLGSTMDLGSRVSLQAVFRAEGGFIISNETELIRQAIGYNKFDAEFDKAMADPSTPTSVLQQFADEYGMRHPSMFSDWMSDGDYIKFEELSLTYRVPEEMVARFGLGATSVTLNGRNLKIWSKYDGIVDPGAGLASRSEFLQNIDYMTGPTPRRFGITIRTTAR